jgi:hypothetical protein
VMETNAATNVRLILRTQGFEITKTEKSNLEVLPSHNSMSSGLRTISLGQYQRTRSWTTGHDSKIFHSLNEQRVDQAMKYSRTTRSLRTPCLKTTSPTSRYHRSRVIKGTKKSTFFSIKEPSSGDDIIVEVPASYSAET